MADEANKKTLQYILIGVFATLLVTLAFGIVDLYFKSNQANMTKQKVIEPRPQLGKLENLGTFIVNLADTEEAHYLRAQIEVEQNFGSSPEFGNEIGNRKSQLRDIVIATMSAKNSAELITPEGKEALKLEIKERVNSVLAKGQIARVYFTQFAVQ
jgi:flagellar protein FliL